MSKSLTGVMISFVVFKDDNIVGHGYAIYHNGKLSQPFLVSNDTGERLPEDWYKLMTIEHQLVVVNETIQ